MGEKLQVRITSCLRTFAKAIILTPKAAGQAVKYRISQLPVFLDMLFKCVLDCNGNCFAGVGVSKLYAIIETGGKQYKVFLVGLSGLKNRRRTRDQMCT